MKFLYVATVLLAAIAASAEIVPLEFVPATNQNRVRSFSIGSQSIDITSKEGGDYTGPINIGGSSMHVVLDTGSSNLAVAGQTCSCGAAPNSYNMGGTDTQNSISVDYGSGSWSGTVYTDTVEFGGKSTTASFGVITSQSTFFTSDQYSGILGLAFQKIAKNNIPPLLKSMGVEQFGLQLCRGQGSSAGHMVLGSDAYNSGMFSGSLQYTPLTPQYFSTPGYYTITANSISVGGSQAMGSFYPIVDSGTNSLVLPGAAYNSLISAIQDATGQSLQEGSECPSTSSLPDITVSVSDSYGNPFSLTITGQDYCPYLDGANRLMASSSSQFHILGTPLLNHYYGLFDKSGQRVGFAPLSNCGNSFKEVSNSVDGGAAEEPVEEDGMSRGVVAGIAAGSTLAVVGVVAAVVIVLRRRSQPDRVPMVRV